jgi:endoglucanase
LVDLDKPLPDELAGKASFNLELFPEAYFGKTFHLGGTCGVFPRQANGPMVKGADGGLSSATLAEGSRLVVAAEDPERRTVIERAGGELLLLDGRNNEPSNWFVVRAMIPAGASRSAVECSITPHRIPGWRRKPVICISQVGYHPDQVKRAVVELDAATEDLGEAKLLRIDPDGETSEALSKMVEKWGRFLRYEYAIFDFSDVREPGMYLVRYGEVSSQPIRITADVYREGVWQPTLETYFPVQMCHMEVRDGWRVWHGACHLDDALQAPTDHVHFDGYRQGPDTDTQFSEGEHIPGLNKGGWHDAGDYDLAAGSQAETTFVLSLARETFGIDTDQTTVLPNKRLVLLHKPDGTPDIVQQIAHGVENLLSGYRASGHSFAGIIAGSMGQYVHLGDAVTMTDNRVYDPSLGEQETDGERSGKNDDRWAFTSRDTSLEFKVVAALAAASRTLKGYCDDLAEECLRTCVKVWDYEQSNEPVEHRCAYVPGRPKAQEVLAAVEMLITTGEERYRKRLVELLPAIEEHVSRVGWSAARVLERVGDQEFARKVGEALAGAKAKLDEHLAESPFGVPFDFRIWGVGWQIQEYAVGQYYLVKAYPDRYDRENVLRVLNYVLGCHPGSSVSLVSGVGARSLTVAFGTNRAEWSYIPGGMAAGTNLSRPDFPELKDNWPFLWQQTEYVMSGAATYVFCVLAAEDLLSG